MSRTSSSSGSEDRARIRAKTSSTPYLSVISVLEVIEFDTSLPGSVSIMTRFLGGMIIFGV
jgi:hypothetical protein